MSSSWLYTVQYKLSHAIHKIYIAQYMSSLKPSVNKNQKSLPALIRPGLPGKFTYTVQDVHCTIHYTSKHKSISFPTKFSNGFAQQMYL